MLAAVLADFARVGGVEPLTLVDEGGADVAAGNSQRQVRAGEEAAAFRELARWADYTLVIAPEFDGLLETRCRWALEAGGRLLGPSPEAVGLAGDKLRLGRHLESRGIPTPRVLPSREPWPRTAFPAVLKPRHGAGSRATFLLGGPEELAAWVSGDQGNDETLIQAFVPGIPASVALLIGPRQRIALLPAAQHLSGDARFRYLGGSIPLAPGLAVRAVRLAERAAAAVSGLQGYVGVDLVLGDTADGSRDWVIELNPRLTTSYVGLRVMAQTNLAEAMLRVVRGEPVPEIRWHPGTVRFRPDGLVTR
jgi:predicted ATP-grasp superfamily ATP-dependent carboligase